MVLLAAARLPPGSYLDIWGLDELRGISVTDDGVVLGALSTYSDVLANETLHREHPMVCQAANVTGSLAIQNRGTLGGNIVNASPAADSPPALLAYDAEVELISEGGSRWLDYHDFHTGYKQMRKQPHELVSRVRLPRRPGGEGALHVYRKVGTREAQAIAKVCFAGLGALADGVVSHLRVALGSVAPTVVRCHAIEGLLVGKPLDDDTIDAAVVALGGEISPIDDIRSSADYRRAVSENLLVDFLRRLRGRG